MCRSAFVLVAGVLIVLARGPAVRADDDVAQKARAVLEKHCYACHGKDGTNEGGMNFILNRDRLVAAKKVVPNDVKASPVAKRLKYEEMPPEEDLNGKPIKIRPTKEEIEAINTWIEAGAPEFNAAPAARKFIPNTAVLEFIAKDLSAADERQRKYLRYFTITHLYNAGLSEDELQSYRLGLSKLVNSLSWGKQIKPPVAIDPAQTVFRIDLRDYDWKAETWDRILKANPYGVTYATAAAKACYEQCQTPLPHVRADWFVFAASRPPLYHEVLDLPKTDVKLEEVLRVDVAQNIRDAHVARAAFNGSGVSRNNRLIERHASPYGAYWKSYDFATNTGRQNLFEKPLGPGAEGHLFKQDGGEIIFNLPNGLQAYFLVDANGNRIDKGPINIVSDPKQGDRSVVNGVSCMSCHAQGMVEKADLVRDHVEKNADGFGKNEADAIKAMYLPKDDFLRLLRADADRFRRAVEACGSRVTKTEPVSALAGQFEREIDLKLAAAEVGLPSEEFDRRLNDERLLQRAFGTLRIAGGTVQRQVLVEHFGKLVEVMLPDAKTSGPDVAPGRPPEGAAGRKRPKPLIAPFTAAQAATAQKAWADYLGKKVEEEVHVGGGVKMVFVLIPPGVYEMGSPASELTVNYYVKAQKDETPQHEVTISEPFYIGKFEVTQAEFGQIGTKKERNYFTATGYFKDRAEGIDTSRFPVETIKFEEADDFCKQFKVKAKLSPGWVKARLPSEAMWEYACRAGTTTRWNVGDRLTKAEANIGRDPGLPERDLDRTWEVGSGKANNFGLYDMHGNVWEWCSDLKKDYEAKNQVDPEIRDGKSPPAVRGGGFRDPPRRTRSATRYGDGPWFPSSDIGFRVVLVPAVPGK